jgi:hypothetical protein
MLSFTEALVTLQAVAPRFALSLKYRFANPAIRPFSAYDFVLRCHRWHQISPLVAALSVLRIQWDRVCPLAVAARSKAFNSSEVERIRSISALA